MFNSSCVKPRAAFLLEGQIWAIATDSSGQSRQITSLHGWRLGPKTEGGHLEATGREGLLQVWVGPCSSPIKAKRLRSLAPKWYPPGFTLTGSRTKLWDTFQSHRGLKSERRKAFTELLMGYQFVFGTVGLAHTTHFGYPHASSYRLTMARLPMLRRTKSFQNKQRKNIASATCWSLTSKSLFKLRWHSQLIHQHIRILPKHLGAYSVIYWWYTASTSTRYLPLAAALAYGTFPEGPIDERMYFCIWEYSTQPLKIR